MTDILIRFFLPCSLAFIMLGMGITLTLSDFTRILKYPKAIVIGLITQLLLLPLIGFLLILIFHLDTAMAIGIMILVSCPGGATSNLVTQICKGNIALSVSLTAITSFTNIFTTQLIMAFALSYFNLNTDTVIKLPFLDTTLQIILITGIPILLGMCLKAMFPSFSKKAEKPMKLTSTVIFAIIFTGLVVTNFDLLGRALKRVGLVTLLLNLSIIFIGYGVSRALKLNIKDSIAIASEGSVQNATLALVIATNILNSVEMGIPTAAYTIWMYLSSAILMWWFGRKHNTIN